MLVLASHVLGLCGECQTAGPASRDAQPAWLAQLKGRKFFGQIQLKGGKIGGETGSKYPKIEETIV